MDSEFEKDKKINPSELDLEACQQPELFFKWAEKAVKARAEVDKSKMQVDLIESELSLQCREKPEEFGLKKVTEAAIGATIKTHRVYVEAYKDFIKARESSALYDVARDAMEQKKRMIEVLVTLHGQQYFAGPSVPRDLVAAWKEAQEGRTKSVDERQGRKVRRRANDNE